MTALDRVHGMTALVSGRSYPEVLTDAVSALTEAARAGWDWAEFVALTTTAAAANVGGIEWALRGRPGSWEADHVRGLITGTAGDDDRLLEHRTAPIVIDLNVEDSLCLTDGAVAWEAALCRADDLDAAETDPDDCGRYDHVLAERDRQYAAYGEAVREKVLELAAARGARVPA